MRLERRGFFFLVALLAAAAPALGQRVSPVPGRAEAVGSVPDFSGMWVHPYFPGIEPPASGPGPIFNRSRSARGAGNNGQFVGDYTNPILKPATAAIVKSHGEISLSGVTYPSNRCWPMLSKNPVFRLAARCAVVFRLNEPTGIEESAVQLDLDYRRDFTRMTRAVGVVAARVFEAQVF